MALNLSITNNINIIIPDGPLLLSFSGGADSTLLLYILLKNAKDAIHVSSLITHRKKDKTAPIIDRIIDKCKALTNNNNVVRHICYKDDQIPLELENYTVNLVKDNNCTIGYNAVTAFPPGDIIVNFRENIYDIDPMTYKRREYGIQRSLYYARNKMYRPFINNTKLDIAMAYRALKIENELYPITRSCETFPPTPKHCGHCFWCQERAWGFGYLE